MSVKSEDVFFFRGGLEGIDSLCIMLNETIGQGREKGREVDRRDDNILKLTFGLYFTV